MAHWKLLLLEIFIFTRYHSAQTHFSKCYKNLTIFKSSQVNNRYHKFFDGKRTFGFKLVCFWHTGSSPKKRKEFSRTVEVPSMFWRLDYICTWIRCACGFQNLFFEIATSSQRLLLEIALTSRAPVLYRGRSQLLLWQVFGFLFDHLPCWCLLTQPDVTLFWSKSIWTYPQGSRGGQKNCNFFLQVKLF